MSLYEISNSTREKLHEILEDESKESAAHQLIIKLRYLKNNDAPKLNTQKDKQQLKQLNKMLGRLCDSAIHKIVWKAAMYDENEEGCLRDPTHRLGEAFNKVNDAIRFLEQNSVEPFLPPIQTTKRDLLKEYLPRIMGVPYAQFTEDDFALDGEIAEIVMCIYDEVDGTVGSGAARKALQRLSKDKKPTSTST